MIIGTLELTGQFSETAVTLFKRNQPKSHNHFKASMSRETQAAPQDRVEKSE
jgi:hypothetical protein